MEMYRLTVYEIIDECIGVKLATASPFDACLDFHILLWKC